MNMTSERLESYTEQVADAVLRCITEAYMLGFEDRRKADELIAEYTHTVPPQPCTLGRLRKFEAEDGHVWYETPDGKVNLADYGTTIADAEDCCGKLTVVA